MCYVQIAMAAITLIAGAEEAKNERQVGDANQKIEENNAKLAEQQGQDAAVLGARESQQSAWRQRALIGQQRAAIAAAGLDQDVGTPFDLTTESALFGGADRSAIAQDAARKAWGFQADALNARNRGAQAKWQGHSQAKLTILNSIGQSLSYFGSMGGYQAPGGGGASTSSSLYANQINSGPGSAYNFGNNVGSFYGSGGWN